jgi:hypothetical protein
MFYVSIAYLLWLFGGFGTLGLHRFYLRRIGTGFLWFFTGGLFLIGAIYDFFAIPRMVRENNLGLRYREALFGETGARRPSLPKESVERVILRTAQKNRGVVTPGEVALEGDFPLDDAKKYLEKLVSQGFAEMKVRESGVIVYVFPDFRPDDGKLVDI